MFLQKKNYTMNGKNTKQIPERQKENKKSIQVSQNLVNILYKYKVLEEFATIEVSDYYIRQWLLQSFAKSK